ncbi:MAG: DUF1080 domain-containing protein [Planctomycetaceae bacterium]|nr:DUF1080 domain-containing protein [Planctomycetaceae bacterium]
MNQYFFSVLLVTLASLTSVGAVSEASAGEPEGTVILDDDFNREEQDPQKEQIGNDWNTNSKSRAKGEKQVDLVDGAMHITRAKVADHGVSVTHEVVFQDSVIRLRFKLDDNKDDLGINIADMKEKSVHAGHICMARVRTNQVEIADLKTGRMNLETRERRLAGKLTADDKKRIANTAKRFKIELTTGQWHDLEVRVMGDEMSVAIDGQKVGVFQSTGIGHATKSRLRLAINRSAWVDDVKVTKIK